MIEKNNNLKTILSNNYIELLNCSDLISKLSSFSETIHSSTEEQERIFLENYLKINNDYQAGLSSKLTESKESSLLENLRSGEINEQFLHLTERVKKISRKFKTKGLGCFASILLYDLLLLLKNRRNSATIPNNLKGEKVYFIFLFFFWLNEGIQIS